MKTTTGLAIAIILLCFIVGWNVLDIYHLQVRLNKVEKINQEQTALIKRLHGIKVRIPNDP